MAVDPSSFNIESVGQYLNAGKTAIDIIKNAVGLLPKGADKEKAQDQIQRAEEALEMSRASAAKSLGYRLCQCTFPPQIMLWREKEQAHVCSNPECGKRSEKPKVITVGRPRGGPGSWMR